MKKIIYFSLAIILFSSDVFGTACSVNDTYTDCNCIPYPTTNTCPSPAHSCNDYYNENGGNPLICDTADTFLANFFGKERKCITNLNTLIMEWTTESTNLVINSAPSNTGNARAAVCADGAERIWDWDCNAGYEVDGTVCSQCGVGKYTDASTWRASCASCTNATPNIQYYTGPGTSATNCPVSTCTACNPNPVHATCALSVVSNVCTYATSCQPGYGDIHNNGTYNPICTANEISISYDAGGGAGSAPSSPTSFVYDSTTTAPTNVIPGGYTKSGYTFAGWLCTITGSSPLTYCSSTGNNINSTTHIVAAGGSIKNAATSGGITLTAQWTPNTININYNVNTGTGSAASTTCTYDGSCDLSAGGTMSKTGYTLTNWNTALNGSGTNYTPGSSHPALAGPGTDITLYAQWTVATYTIALNDGSGASGGSGTIKEVYGIEWQNSGGIGPIPSVNIPTRSGYEFTGYWAASTGGTTPIIPATGSLINPGLSNTYFTANTTIYAQWAACNAGTYEVSGVCEPCNAGYYCAGGTSHDTCPMGHTSAALSDAITDCYITAGTGGTWFCDDGGARCFQLPDLGSPANNIIHYQN